MVSSIVSTTSSSSASGAAAGAAGTGGAVLGEVGIFLGLILLNVILLSKVLIDAWVADKLASGDRRRFVMWLQGLSRASYVPLGPLVLLFFFAIGRQTITTL